jgi:hypothetical protein
MFFVLLAILMGGCTPTQPLQIPSPSSVSETTEIPLLASSTPAILPAETIAAATLIPTTSLKHTATAMVLPSETPESFTPPLFKLAYSILDGPLQGRWVFDSALETTIRVAERYPGNVNWPWSHDGLRMAVVNNPNGQTLIELINLETDVTSTIFLPNIPRFSSNFHFRGRLNWSSDDHWLAYYESGEVGYDFIVKTWLIDTETKQVLELPTNVYFSSWSHTISNQYLYIFLDYPPRSGPEEAVEGHISVHIGKVGFEEPIYSFPDMGISAPKFGNDILWSPDGHVAVSLGVEQADSQVIRLFFDNDTWEIVQHGRTSQFDFLPSLWSPDSKWIVLWKGNFYYIWDVEQSNEPFALKLPKDVRPLAWTLDSNYLIYYKDNSLYAVSPMRIDQPIQFFDLSNLNLSKESFYTLDLWVDPN